MKLTKSENYYTQAQQHMVGGVNSPVRAFGSVGGNPIFIDRAEGYEITDVDGNTYIDFVLSYGPMILGHRHGRVRRNIRRALRKGYSFGASTRGEIKLAKLICEAFEGMDKVRLVNSGTEAVFSAIRLARAFTGRDKIIKFSGCYHGHADGLLVAAGSGLATLSLPGSAGVPEASVSNTLIANYNDLDSVAAHFDKHDDIAAILIEPIAGNMGVVLPQDDFLAKLKKLASDNGALLVVDEVMTGYRSTYGGAQKLLGVEADITCLGKVIGGGFPVGAYGAREEIMQMVAPLGAMYQAGTLSGNPIAVAAGVATLEELKTIKPYDRFEAMAAEIETALLGSAEKYGVDLQVNRFGSMINAFFTDQPVTNFEQAQASNTEKFATFFWAMIANGIFLPPSQFEAWFLNSALDEEAMSKTKKAIDAAIKAVSEAA